MKLQIEYKKNTDVDAPCVASTEFRGEYICAIGRTWENAKERLMAKLESYCNATVPAPETVEVKVADEEMDSEILLWDEKEGRVVEAGKV